MDTTDTTTKIEQERNHLAVAGKILPEYLGNIDIDILLNNLTNFNNQKSMRALPKGEYVVMAYFDENKEPRQLAWLELKKDS